MLKITKFGGSSVANAENTMLRHRVSLNSSKTVSSK